MNQKSKANNWKFQFTQKKYPSWIYAVAMSLVAIIIYFIFFN